IANGCTDTLVKTHYVNVTGTGCNQTAVVSPAGPLNKCQGDTVILTASTNATAPYTFQWNIGSVAISGANSNTIAITQGGYFSVTVIKNNCPITSSVVQINFSTNPQQPTVTGAGTIIPCVGGAVTLTSSSVSGASYTWNTTPVQSSQSIVVSTSGNYQVTATNSAGCKTISSPYTVNASLAQVPICMVTVDSLSQYNLIAWEKLPNQHVDSFIVYREISTNTYKRIGSVPYSALSLFTDTIRTKYFPNTGDPNAGTYRYKIAIRDTCGNYSPLGAYHNTIYIINNSGTFFWPQLYTIENSSNPVTNYILMRDNNSTGNWQQVQSVAGTQQTVTDPQYSTYQNTASWRVETQWGIGCTSTIVNPKDPTALATNLNTSRSNVNRVNNPIAVNTFDISNSVMIFPNPTTGKFEIRCEKTEAGILEIVDMMGEEIYSSAINSNRSEIDLSKQSGGIYFLRLKTSHGTATKKIILNK
ncbi:MAG TPA: T9SS type A sorting domain-containing protein, partial [Bacteroidia bacterium]